MTAKEVRKRTTASAAAKTKAKPKKKTVSAQEKRVEAAKEAARKFIAGVRAKRRTSKKATSKQVERPPVIAASPPVTAKPAAAKAPAKTASAAPKTASAAPKPAVKADPKPAEKTAKPKAAAKASKPAAKKPATSRYAPRKGAEPAKAVHEPIRRSAEESKYYLGAEQRVMPPVEAAGIPTNYNVDRIVALVRDPHWIFAYWEVTDGKYRELERAFGPAWPSCNMILRVYDRSSKSERYFDIALTQEARNWYINVSAQGRYQIAIGALSPDGRFELVAISNLIETPSDRVSDRVDEQWLVPDDVFERIFAASGGHDMHAASGELKGLLEKRLLEEMSSGAVTSFGSGALYEQAKGRAFRLWVATELILYGGTEPDARVTVQGKEVKLRPDGTFSLRFALPDGKVDLPVTAESADKVEERTIETGVTKKSAKKAPVLK